MAFLNAPGLPPGRLTPEVTTEVIAMVPAEGPMQNLLAGDLPVEQKLPEPAPASNRWRLLPLGFACAVGWLLFPSGRARRRSLLETDASPAAGRILFTN